MEDTGIKENLGWGLDGWFQRKTQESRRASLFSSPGALKEQIFLLFLGQHFILSSYSNTLTMTGSLCKSFKYISKIAPGMIYGRFLLKFILITSIYQRSVYFYTRLLHWIGKARIYPIWLIPRHFFSHLNIFEIWMCHSITPDLE